MGQIQRPACMDVSNTVDVSAPAAVKEAVGSLLSRTYHGLDRAVLDALFDDVERLYTGHYPGFRACDIHYHNLQHVLDVTLAMARLLDGHARRQGKRGRLSQDMVLAGMATALFHDSGYIRRTRDTRNNNGAVYTRVHVSRGARFLADYLPLVGLSRLSGTCTRIIHFTGYEKSPDDIAVRGEHELLLGRLLGTADLIAQMADIGYARKCREHLYEEFVQGGMAGSRGDWTHTGTIYRSPEQLLRMTPSFIRSAIEDRLDGHFGGVHGYAADHFGGAHLYMDAIRDNCRRLEAMLAAEGH